MKIQIDLEKDLWIKFRDKVQGDGKTLREVVPTLFEPALREYLDPPVKWKNTCDKCGKEIIGIEWINGDGSLKVCNDCKMDEPPKSPPPIPTVKRCELCDMPVDRLFHSEGRKVCYSCWKGELTKDREPTSNTSPSSEPSPSSVSSPS